MVARDDEESEGDAGGCKEKNTEEMMSCEMKECEACEECEDDPNSHRIMR